MRSVAWGPMMWMPERLVGLLVRDDLREALVLATDERLADRLERHLGRLDRQARASRTPARSGRRRRSRGGSTSPWAGSRSPSPWTSGSPAIVWTAVIPSCAAVCASISPPTMSPIAYRCGSRVRMWPSTLTKPRSTSAVVVSRPDVLDVGGAARGDEQHLRLERARVLALGPDGDPHAVVARRDRRGIEAGVGDDLDPAPVEAALELLAHVAVLERHDRRQVLEQRHLRRRGRGTSRRTRRRPRPRR